MSVVANRTGNTATVTIVFDVSDILALAGVSAAEKRIRGFQRAQAELQAAANTLPLTDAQIDQTAAVAAAAATALKAARPTGSL